MLLHIVLLSLSLTGLLQHTPSPFLGSHGNRQEPAECMDVGGEVGEGNSLISDGGESPQTSCVGRCTTGCPPPLLRAWGRREEMGTGGGS